MNSRQCCAKLLIPEMIALAHAAAGVFSLERPCAHPASSSVRERAQHHTRHHLEVSSDREFSSFFFALPGALLAFRSFNPYIKRMDQFDFNAPAEVFAIAWGMKRPHFITYRRFFTGAEAIRHVMEVLHPDMRRGTIVETDVARFGPAEIRILYQRADYPLIRRKPSRSHGASCAAP